MGGIMFYTDTNGQLPTSCSRALLTLGMVMESTPLDEIDFEVFNSVAPEIDAYELDVFID
jgi:hypothetical protein